MPLRNRVTPQSELIADPARGLVYGNRGCLHDDVGRIRRRYNGKRWIACRLRFKDWHRHPLLQPGKFTELFFLDEATAMAAGHRPCALCRREDYMRFGELWRELHPGPHGADDIDARLHSERVDPATRAQRQHDARLGDLPDGAFVLRDGAPWLVRGPRLLRWSPAGYDGQVSRQADERVRLLTPPSLVAVLRAGWDGAGLRVDGMGEPGRDEDRRRALDNVDLVAEHDLAHKLVGRQDQKELGEGVLLGAATRVAHLDPVDGDGPLRLGMGHNPARRAAGGVLEAREPPRYDEVGVAAVRGGAGRRRKREAPRRGLGEAPYPR